MKYKIAICDDQEEDTRYIASAVGRWAEKQGLQAEMSTFPSGESFLFQYAEQNDYDILLLDIEMPGINGVELAKRIRKENDSVQIVFITGFPDFISEGYEVSALHYLMKPVSEDKLSDVLNRAVNKLNRGEKSVIFSVDSEKIRVPVSNIMYVEAFAHSCRITTDQTSFEVKSSISSIEKMLVQTAEGEIVRCHRSYMVGVRHIQRISKTDVILDNDIKIPLSRGSYQAVNQAFILYFKGESQWD